MNVLQEETMAEQERSTGAETSNLSEGSDIAGVSGDDNITDPDFEVSEPIDRDLWMRHMFAEDEDNEEVFEGFDTEWKTENYHCITPVFNRTPGVKIDQPADATPMQAFERNSQQCLQHVSIPINHSESGVLHPGVFTDRCKNEGCSTTAHHRGI